MSDVVAIFSGLDEAYGKKTLKLLQSRHSQMYLALFKALFPDTSQGMVADELWSRMDECLSDLEEAGYGELLPKDAGRVKSGRSLCHDLIDRYNWVESKRREDGQMEYRLTSDAIEALETRAQGPVAPHARRAGAVRPALRPHPQGTPAHRAGTHPARGRPGGALRGRAPALTLTTRRRRARPIPRDAGT